MLLPYHVAPYAWDDPEVVNRCLVVRCVGHGSGRGGGRGDEVVGEFELDGLAPCSELPSSGASGGFVCRIVADGPTRVLRISDSRLGDPDAPMEDEAALQTEQAQGTASRQGSRPGWGFDVMCILNFGVGVSLVDSAPAELMFWTIGDVVVRRELTAGGEGFDSGVIVVGDFCGDNQLWRTPFPAMVRVRGDAHTHGKDSQSSGRGRRVRKGTEGVERRRRLLLDVVEAPGIKDITFDDNSVAGYPAGGSNSASGGAAFRVKWVKDLRWRNKGSAGVSLVKELSVLVSPLDVKIDGALALRVLDMAGMVAAVGGGGRRKEMNEMNALEGGGRNELLLLNLGGGGEGQGEPHAGVVQGEQKGAGEEGARSRGDTDRDTGRDAGRDTLTRVRSERLIGGGAGTAPTPGRRGDRAVTEGTASREGGGEEIVGGEGERKVYFEHLHVSPISIRLSFILPANMLAGSGGGSSNMSAGMSAVIGFLSMTNISSIDSAPITLRGFTRSHIYGTTRDHVDVLVRNYKSLLWGQATLLALSSELLGNPLKLMRAVRDGVQDFGYELSEGWGNGNIAGAVVGGVRGLVMIVQNVSYSWLRSVAKSLEHTASSVTAATGSLAETTLPEGAVGRLVARWAEDADVEGIVMARRKGIVPRDKSLEWVQAGIGKVVPVGIVEGVLQALVGLISEPVARSQEVSAPFFLVGVARGLFRGILGGGVKVTVGMLKSSAVGFGIAGRMCSGGLTIEEGEGGGGKRIRAPRYFLGAQNEEEEEGKMRVEGNLLVPYEEGENVGFELLSRVEGGVYLSDGYLCHVPVHTRLGGKGEQDILVMTEKRCALVGEGGGGGGGLCVVKWKVEYKDVVSIEVDDEGLKIYHVSREKRRQAHTPLAHNLCGGDEWRGVSGISGALSFGLALESKSVEWRGLEEGEGEVWRELRRVVGVGCIVVEGVGWEMGGTGGGKRETGGLEADGPN